MTDKAHPLQSLIDAPLANATRINLPGGKLPAPRARKPEYADEIGCPKLTGKEVRERKAKAADAKLESLFAYYADTDLPPATVAEHMGLYRNEPTGEKDDKGRPLFKRVLDVERVEQQLAWRRKAA